VPVKEFQTAVENWNPLYYNGGIPGATQGLWQVSQKGRGKMAEKKEYRNAVRSRRMIREAFVELLHEKAFEKITATDIINRSGLNRSTFYAHYPDVKGIIDEITGQIVAMFRQMLAEMDFSHFLNEPEPNLKKVVAFLEENQVLYRLLGKSDMSLVYLDQLKKVMIQQALEAPNLPTEGLSRISVDIRIRMLLSGIIDAYREWLAGGIDYTLEEMTTEVANIIQTWSKN
jgi:AcrR family transcriptional regulator